MDDDDTMRIFEIKLVIFTLRILRLLKNNQTQYVYSIIFLKTFKKFEIIKILK